MLSIMLITWNRGKITPGVLEKNLMHMTSGEDVELLIADQGSTDREIVDMLERIRLWEVGQTAIPEFKHANVMRVHRRLNRENEGVGRTLNQLAIRAHGDVLMTMGNDILMPPGWDAEMLGYVRGVPNSGIIGMDWGHGGTPPVSTKYGIHARWLDNHLDKVFGPMMFRRQVVDEIGFFHEGFHPYGFEDSDFNNRVNRAGFNSCYSPTFKCEHVGNDVGDGSPYRRMKDQSMTDNLSLLGRRMQNYDRDGLVEPLPELRPPL